MNESESVTAITLDQFYNKFENIRQNTKVVNIVIASIKDELSKPVKAGYMLTEGRKIKKIPEDAPVIRWKELHMGKHCFYNYKVKRTGKDPAVILYSGGTTGTTKGILLSNRNFNALGQQVIAANPMFRVGDKMLAAMPLFHGFGLGVCIHTMLAGRPLHPHSSLHRTNLCKADNQIPLQLHCRRSHALRSAAAPAEHGQRRPQLAQGRGAACARGRDLRRGLRVDTPHARSAHRGRAADVSLGNGTHFHRQASEGAVYHLSGAVFRKLLPPDAKRIQVTASDDAAILSMVSCGLGVSILSSLSLAGYEGQVKTIPLEIPVVVRVGVAIKSLESASTSARRFVRFLKNHYGVSEAELRLIRIRLLRQYRCRGCRQNRHVSRNMNAMQSLLSQFGRAE